MENTAKDRKFNILFAWFDQGQDGYITRDDFQAMAKLFTALPGGSAPENEKALRDAFDKWWALMLAAGDTSQDGRLDRGEFIKLMKSSAGSPGNLEQAVLAIIDVFMRLVDTDNNGALSFSEYVRMYDALGIDPKHSSDAFKRLDRDGDGTLSYDEFRTAILEFYFSEDQNAPGNWLLGPLF